MSQLQQITDEEIRDEVFAIIEEHEKEATEFTEKIDKIKTDADILLDRKIIAIKNKLIDDNTVSEEDFEKVCLKEIELAGEVILEEVKKQVEILVKKRRS